MSILIKDNIQLQLEIADQLLDLKKVTIDYCHIAENPKLGLPAMSIQLKDTIQFFSSKTILLDGNKIKFTVGTKNRTLIYNMRIFTHKESLGSSPIYLIYAYLDAPLYWNATTPLIRKGTASAVLSEICEDCGLTYDGVNTNDDQTWTPAARKYREFAKHIRQHAYIDERSCVQMCVTTNKIMRVRNLTDFDKFPVVETFSTTPSSTEEKQIGDWGLLNKAGFFNAMSGYQDTLISQSTQRDDQVFKNVDVKKNTTKLSMNSDVKSALPSARVRHSPVESGNNNDNFYRALYQNERLGNLFSLGIEFITTDLVIAEVFDAVDCQLSRPGAQGVGPISGKYLVSSKVLYITNDNFYQKIEVCRHGLNDKSYESNDQVG